MDRLGVYRQSIQGILTAYHEANLRADSQGVESQLVFDEERDQYLLLLMGWEGDRRVKQVMIHVRVWGGKVWVEEDWTEEGVAMELLAAGVLREEIVLGFHGPGVRQYTEFAIA